MKIRGWLAVMMIAFMFVLSNGSLMQGTSAEEADKSSVIADNQEEEDDYAVTLLWNYIMKTPGAAEILQKAPMDKGLVGWLLRSSTEKSNVCFAEALARKAGLPATGLFTDSSLDSEMIERLSTLSKDELREMQGLFMVIKQAAANEEQEEAETDTSGTSAEAGERTLTNGEIAAFLNVFQDHALMAESSGDVSATTPEPAAPGKPGVASEALSEEEIADLSVYLSTHFALYDTVQKQELSAWLMGLSPEERNSMLTAVSKALKPEEQDAFMNWLRQAYAFCAHSQTAGADSLQLPGRKTWVDFTFPGFPPPAQGVINSVTETTAKNGGTARQIVLTNVRQETLDAWKEQIPADESHAVTKQSADYGDMFYQNIGSSLIAGQDKALSLTQAGSEPVTDYYQAADGSAIEVVYCDGNLVITMLLP